MSQTRTIRRPLESVEDRPATADTVRDSFRPPKKVVDRTSQIFVAETNTAPAFESRRQSIASAKRRMEGHTARAYDAHRAMLLRY